MKKLATMLIAASLLLLTGCGSDSGPAVGSDKEGVKGTLTIVYDPNGLGSDSPSKGAKEYSINCSVEVSFCSKLLEAGLLDDEPKEKACTQQYGGPETIKIVGFIAKDGDSDKIDTTIARNDGCGIAKFNDLSEIVGLLEHQSIPIPAMGA